MDKGHAYVPKMRSSRGRQTYPKRAPPRDLPCVKHNCPSCPLNLNTKSNII